MLGVRMGRPDIIQSLFHFALIVFEICGISVFIVWIVTRTVREIRSIIHGRS